MKRFSSLLLVLCAVPSILLGQEPVLTPQAHSISQTPTVYGIPGSHLLREEEMKAQQYFREHPEVLQQQQLMKRTAWTFQLGDKGPISGTGGNGWWATNLNQSDDDYNKEYVVSSTCRAVGVNCYIFVEDALWDNTTVNQAAVDSIRDNWDNRTPAFSNKGIYQVDVETFGNPPNVDADPKIIILILDIVDGFSGSGGYVAGYFFSVNEGPDPTSGHRSNVAEIYYVDGKQSNLKTTNGITTGMQTAAHEFQHMLNWNYHPTGDTFNNEAASQVAELVCGYPYSGQSLYTDNTDIHLLSWTSSLADYSRGSRWGLYLWKQFPNGLLKQWVQQSGTGSTRISNALNAYPSSRTFSDVHTDWLIANQVLDATVDSRYGYPTYLPSLTKPKATTTYVNPNTNGSVNGGVTGLGADYIAFTGGTNLSVTFTSSFSNVIVKAIKTGPGITPVVQDVTKGSPYNEPAFGSTYTSITFVVINTSTSTASTSYSYAATGTGTVTSTELKWDNTEPTFYYRLTPLDTMCVLFGAVQGARLDSVRVALRRAGTMNGGVWTIGTTTPLGTPLAKPITATTTLTPPVVNQGATYPYEAPYPNWRTVDLRSFNLMANQDFAVGFWLESDTSSAAYVMVTTYVNSGPYNSFTYLNNPSSGGPGWYYISVGEEGEIALWLIRAYASYGTTGAEQVVELLPKSFSLQQNYPNPFNPSTTIRYDLPERSHVRLQIVDALGRVVATLIDRVQFAGSYESVWNGKNLSGLPASSGVYFYRLESGNFREIKRMVLLK